MAPVEPAGTCDELAMQIRQRHPDKWLALTFGGCELYGPQPGGDRSIEVLLGRGAVALLDPKDAGRVGNFEIIFYDEGAAEPLFRAGIGPRTSLTLQPQDDRTGRLSVASRRLSARPAGAGMAFDLSPNGTDLLALSFDDDTIGDSFARDLTVRIKLAALSQKTWRGKQAMALANAVFSLLTCCYYASFEPVAYKYSPQGTSCLLLTVFVSASAAASSACAVWIDERRAHLQAWDAQSLLFSCSGSRLVKRPAGCSLQSIGCCIRITASLTGQLLRNGCSCFF